MKYELVKYLVCPETGESLKLEVLKERYGQVEEGHLISSEGKCSYPITNYIPRFVQKDAYAGTFSKQRLYVKRHFKYYKHDPLARSLFYQTTGFSRGQVVAGLTLEVGCGYGRFVNVLQQDGGEVVGVDLSTHSIDLAQSFVGLKPKVHLIQCDLFRLPFRAETFSSIYSIGVLHHTPDCKKAFHKVSKYLAPNGQISIWVYHPSNQREANTWRWMTTKWRPSFLYAFCILNQSLFSWIRMIPVVRWEFNKWVPGSVPKRGQHFWLRVLEDFDNFSPQYASSHTSGEVAEWFSEAGLSDIQPLDRLTAVTGYRRESQLCL
jgi:SAM-dependent methyltransferase